jgi:hypothetical protein
LVCESKVFVLSLSLSTTSGTNTQQKKYKQLLLTEPAWFIDDEDENGHTRVNLNKTSGLYTKTVNENDSLKLECLANGRPKPQINWSFKHSNGTSDGMLNTFFD